MWNIVIRLAAQVGRFVGGMNAAGASAAQMGNTTAGAVAKGTLAARLMEKVLGGITDKFFQALAMGKKFTDLANRMNLRPQEVAALAEAAESTGVPLKALLKSFNDLRKLGAEGATGGLKKNLKEAAELMGLSASEFKTLQEGGSAALVLIGEKYKAINDEAEQFNLLLALHGKNGQMMEGIYEQTSEEIKSMMDGQVTATDAVLQRNKESAEAFDRMGDRLGVFVADIASWFSGLIKAVAWLVDALGLVWDFLGRISNAIGSVIDGIGNVLGAGVSAMFGDTKAMEEYADKGAKAFQDSWQSVVDWWEKDYLTTFATGTKELLGIDINPEETARKAAEAEKKKRDNHLKKPPEAVGEEKKKREDLQKELEIAEKKREYEKASNAEKKAILDKEMTVLTGKEAGIAEAYADEQEKLMIKMGKTWEIPPDAYKQSSAYLELQKQITEQKDRQVELEKDIAKEAEKAKKEAEDAAKKAAEDEKKKAKAAKDVENARTDAITEIARRELEESEATATEKAQFELAVEQEKMNRLLKEQADLRAAGDEEAAAAMEKDIIAQGLAIDKAQRDVTKGIKEDEETAKSKFAKGPMGKGDSLTASGLGGGISFSPIDLAKQSLNVQKSMDKKLGIIAAAAGGKSNANGYVNNQTVTPYPQ